MSEDAVTLLHRSYAPAVHRRLSLFPSRDQLPIASWLIQNPVGTNYALQILENLEDLARKEDQAPASVLFQTLGILKGDKLQPKDLGRQIRDELSRRIHPSSHSHRETFEAWARHLSLPEGSELLPPQNFEGRRYTLGIAFESTPVLRERLEAALELLDHPEWERLWEF